MSQPKMRRNRRQYKGYWIWLKTLMVICLGIAIGGVVWWGIVAGWPSKPPQALAFLRTQEGSVELWLVDDVSETAPKYIYGDADRINYPIDPSSGRQTPFSSDGRRLLFMASYDDAVDVVCVDRKTGQETLLVRDADEAWAQFSPDGRQVLVMEEAARGLQDLYLIRGCDPQRRTDVIGGAEQVWATYLFDGNILIRELDDDEFSYSLLGRNGKRRIDFSRGHKAVGAVPALDGEGVLWWDNDHNTYWASLKDNSQRRLSTGHTNLSGGLLGNSKWAWLAQKDDGVHQVSLLSLVDGMRTDIVVDAADLVLPSTPPFAAEYLVFASQVDGLYDLVTVSGIDRIPRTLVSGVKSVKWQFDPKSAILAMSVMDDGGAELLAYNPDSNQMRQLYTGKTEITNFDLAGDSSILAYVQTIQGVSRIHLLSLLTEEPLPVPFSEGYAPSWAW